jgi:DNA-binding transcriptional LysR family regulator
LRGQLHAALGIQPIEDEDLWVKIVGREGFSVCIPRGHPLANRADVRAKDLHGQVVFWVPPSLHPGFYEHVMKYIHSLGIAPVFKEARGQSHAFEFAAQGFGLALLPRSAARLSRTGVVIKPITDRYLAIETVLFMRRDQRSGTIKDFIDDLFIRLQALRLRSNDGDTRAN